MIHFRTGSQVHMLVSLLSVVGEYPMCSLHLLGNERVLKMLIHKLTTSQTIRNFDTGEEITVRTLTVTGKAASKTIRLYKAALPILDWIGARESYMSSFQNHRFPGDAAHRERNHRVAEVVAMCMRAGIAFKPYETPALQNRTICRVIPKQFTLYLAKDLKRIGETEMNKTMFTRMVGALFSEDRCYAVYNTRSSVMKWSGMGEFKTLYSLMEISRLNSDVTRVDTAILFGESDSIALNTLLESDKSRRSEFRFDSIYRHVYYIPLLEAGIRQLAIMKLPNWNEALLDLLFEPDTRSYNKGRFEYDAFIDGVYVLSHLDGDIARLIRFRDAIQNQQGHFEVLCYPHQVRFLREYLDPCVSIKEIDINSVETELGQEMEDAF